MEKTNEIGSINREQEKVIKTLEDVLSFLKSVQIKNEESLVHIRKPLDDLQSSLKYLPTDSPFSNLPTEIMTDVLSYLCDSGAFLAASVCQDWEDILKERLENTEVIIGKHCSNAYKCEDYKCFIPAEMLKVSAACKLDILNLQICHPIPEVNSELVTDGLSVSDLTIQDDCKCNNNDETKPVLSNHQLEHFIDGIEKSEKVMNRLELKKLDLTHLDQDKLINCLLTKTEQLELDCKLKTVPNSIDNNMLNVEMLIGKLLQDSPDIKLSDLTLINFKCSDELGEDLADALCKVENVSFCGVSPLSLVTIKKLILNILTGPIKTKQLTLDFPKDFRNLISPEDLRILIEKFELLHLWAGLTLEQLEAARLVAEVEPRGRGVNGMKYYCITKEPPLHSCFTWI